MDRPQNLPIVFEVTATELYLHTYVASIPATAVSSDLDFFACAEKSELGSTNCSNVHSYKATGGSLIVTGGYTIL